MDDHDARLRLPRLSAAGRELLAQRIASIDGVTCAEAHRQIDDFMRIDLRALTGQPSDIEADIEADFAAQQAPAA